MKPRLSRELLRRNEPIMASRLCSTLSCNQTEHRDCRDCRQLVGPQRCMCMHSACSMVHLVDQNLHPPILPPLNRPFPPHQPLTASSPRVLSSSCRRPARGRSRISIELQPGSPSQQYELAYCFLRFFISLQFMSLDSNALTTPLLFTSFANSHTYLSPSIAHSYNCTGGVEYKYTVVPSCQEILSAIQL